MSVLCIVLLVVVVVLCDAYICKQCHIYRVAATTHRAQMHTQQKSLRFINLFDICQPFFLLSSVYFVWKFRETKKNVFPLIALNEKKSFRKHHTSIIFIYIFFWFSSSFLSGQKGHIFSICNAWSVEQWCAAAGSEHTSSSQQCYFWLFRHSVERTVSTVTRFY